MPCGLQFVGLADHAEQGMRLRGSVDHPVRVEDLVAAVLGVRLREHGEFDVGGIAANGTEVLKEVVDLVRGQREPHLPVGFPECRPALPATGEHRYDCHGSGFKMAEQRLGLIEILEYDLRHPVVQQRQNGCPPFADLATTGEPVRDAALDAAHGIEPAAARDVGGFRGPWGDRSHARYGQQHGAFGFGARRRLTIIEQALQDAEFIASQCAIEFGEMPVLGAKYLNGAAHAGELGVELVEPEGGEGRGTAQLQDDRHGRASVK